MTNNGLNVLREVVEKGFGMADMNVIDKYVCDDYIEHQFGRPNGKEILKMSIIGLSQAFSERKYELIQYAIVDDKVWGHYLFTGVHTGIFYGHQPTGIRVNIHVMDIVTIENNQIIEHWGVPDRLALLMQIGATGVNNK